MAADTHDHPTVRLYVQIAAVLFVLTALEFSTYFIEFGGLHVPLLLGLMAIKFVLVAGYFMHLKFDSKVFGRLMGLGLFSALLLYGVAIAAIGEMPML